METSTAQPDLLQIIAALQDPAAYTHPIAGIHVVQTHVSCVFLTGDYVYKVKKPVDFGFLNYSTPELRRHFCDEEVRLNRRLCPDIYLETTPLTWRHGCLQVGGEGEPVDWAVKMRQLREAEMMPARLAAGTIGADEIERIARALAAFHAAADISDAIQAYGRPEVVFDVIAFTLDTMDRVAKAPIYVDARRDLRAFLEGFRTREELFHRRVTEGRVRDCHGDLRLQNICLDPRYDNGIQIFDCIEFNDELRYIDTAADIAYLAMDLDLAGRPDLRARLIDTYAAAAGDTSLREILPFYMAYRACVRGNIALMAAAESELEAAERKAQRDIAAAAYALGRCQARRRSRPALLITRGFSGCGKSQLARELSRRLPAVHLSTDRVRKELAGVPTTETLDAAQYTPAQRAAVYEEVRRRAESALRSGEHVLLDATFQAEAEINAAAELARTVGAEFWIVDCRCPDAIIRERLLGRRRDPNASDADLAVYLAQRDRYRLLSPDNYRSPETGLLLPIDTSQTPGEAAAEVVAHFCYSNEPHNAARHRV
jgi:aminoglycoside phosphotransferase family enzyme/predicted kinase